MSGPTVMSRLRFHGGVDRSDDDLCLGFDPVGVLVVFAHGAGDLDDLGFDWRVHWSYLVRGLRARQLDVLGLDVDGRRGRRSLRRLVLVLGARGGWHDDTVNCLDRAVGNAGRA